MITLDQAKIGIIGLGYVGLPLAVEFGKKYPTTGFDINEQRVKELQAGNDSTLEVEPALLSSATHLGYSSTLEDLKDCNIYIVTVPTPIDRHKQPILTPLIQASQSLARVVSTGDTIIYESTVYPGTTEEICAPYIESGSGLRMNQDFYVGYSPERINPGDKEHRVSNIMKVTSGSTTQTADLVDDLYRSIITAGTHKASSIRVAEASKVIENTQRDLNIALVNELAVIFQKLGIDTLEVLEAAGTKWNFLPFRPGLVGGHCIGVDPYYLTHKAQETGYHPELILAGRRINDQMGEYIIIQVTKLMTLRKIHVVDANVLLLGFSFKENCPDLRNTRVIDMVNELKGYHANIDIYDPWVDPTEAKHEYGIELTTNLKPGKYDAVIIAVAHNQFKEMGINKIRELCKPEHIIYDVKYVFNKDEVDGRI
jgi:UDP-N-acetyl-D-galactosamine dehydrogenase